MSCNGTPSARSFNKTKNTEIQKASKTIPETKNQKMPSLLYELALSSDADSFAKKHNILLHSHRIRVIILLKPSTPDSEKMKLIKSHNIMIEKGAIDMFRALVPVNQLVSLSEEPVVRFIQLPDQFIKTRKIRP